MTTPKRNDWERLIVGITQTLENADITNHLDGSTAVFVHGIDFEMDDVDITVKWGQIEAARDLFKEHKPSPLPASSPGTFHFQTNGLKVHIMSYESSTGIGDLADREQVTISDTQVWSKTVEFYRRHMPPDHPLAKSVASYIRNCGKTSSLRMHPTTLRLRPITPADVAMMLSWRYPAPYHIYNASNKSVSIEDIAYFTQPKLCYHSVLDEHNEMIAFRCFGLDAQVPGGDYTDDALDLGGGLRPDLTGQGLGRHVIAVAMNFAIDKFAPTHFRTTVAGFNLRAKKVCHSLGYRRASTFMRPRDRMKFIVMTKAATSMDLKISSRA